MYFSLIFFPHLALKDDPGFQYCEKKYFFSFWLSSQHITVICLIPTFPMFHQREDGLVSWSWRWKEPFRSLIPISCFMQKSKLIYFCHKALLLLFKRIQWRKAYHPSVQLVKLLSFKKKIALTFLFCVLCVPFDIGSHIF